MRCIRHSLTVLVVTLFFLQLSWSSSESWAGQASASVPDYGWAEIMAIFSREKSLEEARLAKLRFEEIKEQILDQMRTGTMSLRQARADLILHAGAGCSVYLAREKGSTLGERAGYYLVGHLQKRAQLRLYPPEASAPIARLAAQLQE
jgi:hypothetical protein